MLWLSRGALHPATVNVPQAPSSKNLSPRSLSSQPPTPMLPRAPVTVTSGPYQKPEPLILTGDAQFAPSPVLGQPISATEGAHHPRRLSQSLDLFLHPLWPPQSSLRLSHRRPQNPRPAEGDASRTERAGSGGGGAAATVTFYEWGSGRREASLLCRAARAALQRAAPIGLLGF